LEQKVSRQQITVSIAGGPRLDSAALSALLGGVPGLQVVPLDMTSRPHVLILDARHNRIPELSDLQGEIAVLILTDKEHFTAIPSGATGLISPEEPPESLIAAIRQVARGEQYLSPVLAVWLLQSGPTTPVEAPALKSLTDREKEILDLLAQGQSNKTIAARMYLSVRTVEGHVRSIYIKLGVHSRAEAMLIAIQNK
jgi:DNA-binding NarL/FixJ family response regulator